MSPPLSPFSLPLPISYLSLPLGHPPYHPSSLLRAFFLTLSSTSSTSFPTSAPPVALAPPVLAPPHLLLLLLLLRLTLFPSSYVSFCYFSFYFNHPAAAAFSSFLSNSSCSCLPSSALIFLSFSCSCSFSSCSPFRSVYIRLILSEVSSRLVLSENILAL